MAKGIMVDMKEKTFNLDSGDYTIKCSTDSKKVGQRGAPSVGKSAFRDGDAKAPRANNCMRAVDALLCDKTMNFIASDSAVYAEFEYEGNKYQSMMSTEDEANDISFVGSAPTGAGLVYPVVAYALAGLSENTEFVERFETAKAEFDEKESLSTGTVMSLSDSFYHSIVRKFAEEIKIHENDFATETIKQAYVSGAFDDLDIIADLDLVPLSVLEGVEPHKKKSSKTKTSISNEMEAWKNGEFTIPYEWSEDQQKRIPSKDILDNFVPNEVFRSLVKKCTYRANKVIDRMNLGKEGVDAIGNDYINCRIVGKPGTGKTMALQALAATLGVPYYPVPITKNTEEDFAQGMTKVVEGNFQFVQTDFLEAYKNGGIVVLEEGNLADPAVMMGVLGQAIEAPFVLAEDGYKTVRRHPLFMCFLTMNVNTFGSKDLNEALASRFRQTFMLDDPTKEEFVNILMKHNSNAKLCNWIYDSYQKILNYLVSPSVNMEELCLNVTVRGCIGALECIEEDATPKQALKETLVGAIGAKELELARQLERDVIDSLPNITV